MSPVVIGIVGMGGLVLLFIVWLYTVHQRRPKHYGERKVTNDYPDLGWNFKKR